jgi:hypothetical protein
MPIFPSPEWMEEFCAALAAEPGAGRTAEVLHGVYRFVIEPEGPLRELHTYDILMRPNGPGEPPTVELVGDGQAPRLTITARYSRWKQLVRGDLDVVMAFMLRRIRVSGDIGALRSASTKPLTNALSAVASEWLDD